MRARQISFMMSVTIPTSVFLRGEAGGQSRRSQRCPSRAIGGEGAPLGAEGVRSFQNRHGDESLPNDNPIKCQKNSVLCMCACNYLVHTSNHLVPLPDLRVATAMATYDLRRGILFTCRLPWQQQSLTIQPSVARPQPVLDLKHVLVNEVKYLFTAAI